MRTINRISTYLLAPVALLAISISSAAYEVHVLTGQGSESKAMDNGKYELAIKRLELRVKNDSPTIDVQLTNLCTAYVVTSQLEKAEDVCERAVEAKGDFVGTAYNSRGVLKALQGDYIAAMADFDRSSNKANYPVARTNFGDQTPAMKRFGTPGKESENSVELAVRNHSAADRTWAAIQKDAEDLTADTN